MKTWRRAVAWMAGVIVFAASVARAQDLDLPRPGAVVVAEVTGQGFVVTDGQRKPLKAEERVRVGAVIATGRRSLVALQLSNGATIQLGSESELEIEEFGQQPAASSGKFADLKAEPTLSRTRLKLLAGDVAIDVKPLRVARGSTFTLVLPAGVLRTGEGALRASTMMSEYGLGICTLELQRGAAELELPGATAAAAVPVGTKLAFALERDKATGAVKVGEMPKAQAK
jgi:hypothetical protein